MPRPKHTPEIIIGKLREVEVLVAKGATVAEASRQIGVTEQTLYRWRKEYGGLRVDQARRLKDLEAENTRLKKLVADLSLDKMILAEASKGRSHSGIGDRNGADTVQHIFGQLLFSPNHHRCVDGKFPFIGKCPRRSIR